MNNEITSNSELSSIIRLITDGVLPAEDVNREHFIQLLKDHRILSRVAHYFSEENSALAQAIQLENQENKLYQLQLVNELQLIGELFSDIAFVPLKGVALSQYLYNDPAERMSRDIDILIDINNVDKATELLVASGYELRVHLKTPKQRATYFKYFHHLELVNNEQQILVELHWRLTSSGAFDLPIETILARAEKINIGSVSYKTLNQNDLISYLTIHGVFHGFFRLQWLFDLMQLKRKLITEDSVKIEENMKRTGIFSFYLTSLKLMETLFDDKMTDAQRNAFMREPKNIKLHDFCLEQIMHNDTFTHGTPKGGGFIKMKNNHKLQYLTGGKTGLLRSVFSRNVRPRNWEYFAFPDSVFGLNHLFSRFIWLIRRLRNN